MRCCHTARQIQAATKLQKKGRTHELQAGEGGRSQSVVKETGFGIYLAEHKESSEKVLLPKKEVDEGMKPGTKVEVFVYLDSSDRLIATRREPMVTIGRTAVLKVKDVTKIGAFLDWGLEKDLLLPFREQTGKVYPGDECLVALYLDKSSRLCATMRVYPYLKKNSPYQVNDQVHGRVYELSSNFGAFVAVDDQYSALIPKRESGVQGIRVGDRVQARVSGVKEDGKLDLSIREKAYLQIDEDAENVLGIIEEFDGVLPFDDKARPETIQREFGLSKECVQACGRKIAQGGTHCHRRRKDPEGRLGGCCFEFYTSACPYRVQSAGRFE